MDDRIRKTLDHIESHLSKKLSLQEMADIACMSPSHFHRTFKKETGYTPFTFIEDLKMTKAFQMLISGKVSVHDLSEQFGYKDYETFTRAFKKHHVLAPDDLKAVAQKIQSEMEVGPNDLIIKTFEVETLSEVMTKLDEVTEKLKELFVERGYSKEDLKKAKVISVMPKQVGNQTPETLVRNKFVIAENQKMWKALLNYTENGIK